MVKSDFRKMISDANAQPKYRIVLFQSWVSDIFLPITTGRKLAYLVNFLSCCTVILYLNFAARQPFVLTVKTELTYLHYF